VHEVLKQRLQQTEQAYRRLKEQVIPQFNTRLMEQGIGAIAIPRR